MSIFCFIIVWQILFYSKASQVSSVEMLWDKIHSDFLFSWDVDVLNCFMCCYVCMGILLAWGWLGYVDWCVILGYLRWDDRDRITSALS